MRTSFFLSHRHKQAGMTLVEMMIALAMSAIGGLVIATVFSNLAEFQQHANFLMAIGEIRMKFQQAIMRPQDWTITTQQNARMACFANAQTTCLFEFNAESVNTVPLALYEHGGTSPQLIYDSAGLGGYTVNGQACTPFGVGNCVLKPILTWKMECNLQVDPNCMSPLISIDLSYNYQGPPMGPVNLNSYGFHLMNGTYPLKSQVCAGAIPSCANPSSQVALCISGAWTCEEFGD